ncbi:MBG domain-containing protein [Gramella sp. MAR_2010_147]|uniref:MBG domain-containing protein n=1 Tax=Gramella sp. MAR_2010_147 TaxID=1250205 RepID=UPI00087BA006|nr:MBG domain-containing protein [Gramella sp. MAR_2010_147]SDS08715.1 Por secretion system C-terminal sorting domain-containing protein [Gramella sp. MAR_2010_147]
MIALLLKFNRLTRLLLLLMFLTLPAVSVVGQTESGQGQSETAASTATVTTDKDDYAPGEYVIITGTGWEPGERVDFTFVETPKPESCVNSHDNFAIADASGNIRYEGFLIKVNHIGVHFVLTATGLSSARIAKTEFTDANVRVRTSSGSITLFAKLTNNLDCSGLGINSNGTANTGNNYSIAVASTPNVQSVQLTAPATNSLGEVFNEWSSNTDFSIDLNNPRIICVRGNVSNGSVTYTANYIACASPSITTSPISKTLTYGDADPTFSVTASGDGLSYQWQFNTTAVPGTWNNVGTNSNIYTVPSPTVSFSDRTYRVVITGSCGTVTSTPVGLTVNKATPTATLAVSNSPQTYTGSGQSATVSISASSVLGTVTNILTGGSASQTNANTYAVTANFVPNDAANYNTLTALPTGNFTIVKAASFTTVTITGAPFAYTGSAITPASVTVTGAGGLNLSPDADYTDNVNAGTASASYSYAESANYLASNDIKTFAIGKADATVTVVGTTVIYDGTAYGASGTAVGVEGETLAGLDLGASFTNVPGGTANWVFTDQTGNYEDESGSVEIVINKADATVTVAGTTETYDGTAYGASGTATGVEGETLAGLDLGASFTNVPGGTANWVFTDQTGNYENESGSVEIVINKADATVTVAGTTVTYDGTAHGASGTAVGVEGEPLAGLDLGASFTNVPGGTANWVFTDQTGNYENESGSVEIVINKADATVIVAGTTVTYDGTVHGASGTAVGVEGEPLAGLDLGASFTNVPGGTANWTFTDQTGNYENESGSVEIVINKADATVTVAGTTVTYDGTAHGASGTAVGVEGEPLAGLDLGASFTNVPGGTANWVFTDQTGNYENESGSVEIVINKADATVTVAGTTVTYDGTVHGASGTAVGVEGEPLAGLDLGASFTNVPGGTANWTFTDQTGNYEDESGSVEIVINKADATVTVAGTTVTYDGTAHGASGTATGVEGEPLAGLDLGASFTNVPGGTANWTFTDQTGNYENESGSVEIVINKADATVTVAGTTETYDGTAYGATGAATGVEGEPLAGLDLGASFTNVPGGTANWIFTDQTGNYENESGSVEIVINKADATVTVAGTTETYDGTAYGAIGAATGVEGEPLAGLDLGASFTNVPGGTANWVFTDQTGNYENESGSVEIVINKADATVTVAGTTVTYDGTAHGASGTAVGVEGEPLAGLDLGASFTNVPGGTANWVFTDQTGNYENESGSVEIVINKADATVIVAGTTVTYDGTVHGASGTAVGVEGEPLVGLDLGASFTNVPGGTANWTFTDQTGNYENESGSVEIVINKADATVTVAGTTVTYDGTAHGASGTATGVEGEPLAGLDLGASFTNVPGGTANWVFTDQTGNYEDESGSVEIVINKADATVTVAGTTVTYDGTAHGASGTATGVEGEPLAGLDLGASFTNVPGGTANWVFTDQTGNYENESGSVEIVINKADATVTVAGTTVTYDGTAHGASGTAVGVEGEPLAGLDLGASFTNVPGGTANWVFTDQTGNYEDESGSVEIVINKADATVTVAGTTVTYDGTAHGASGTATGVEGETLAGLDLGASFTNVPGGTANWVFTDQTGNYEDESGSVEIVINKRQLTVTAIDNSKFCGQVNPNLAVSYSGFANGENENVLNTKPSASTSADVNSTNSSYIIKASGGVDNNYNFTYVDGTLTVNGVIIDASASSNPIQLGTTATLSAQVTPAVAGVSVTFILSEYNNTNTGTFAQSYTATTGSNGIATVDVANLPSDVYKVTAVAGGGCSESEAYLPVYDPNGGFVTGGGWIQSPGTAMESGATGKANFGFNAKYKNGKNNMTEVDGNTNFQFQAGDLHLKSISHDNMSLVISGAKATYRGVGTVNGASTHKFLLIAIDGDVSGGGGTDKFRIRIWKHNSPEILYDNQWISDENSNDATILGGGSIVIHKPKGNNKTMETTGKPDAKYVMPEVPQQLRTLEVAPNPMSEYCDIRFSLKAKLKADVLIFDINGRQLRSLHSSIVNENEMIQIRFERQNLPSGVYICKLITGDGHSYERQIVIK